MCLQTCSSSEYSQWLTTDSSTNFNNQTRHSAAIGQGDQILLVGTWGIVFLTWALWGFVSELRHIRYTYWNTHKRAQSYPVYSHRHGEGIYALGFSQCLLGEGNCCGSQATEHQPSVWVIGISGKKKRISVEPGTETLTNKFPSLCSDCCPQISPPVLARAVVLDVVPVAIYLYVYGWMQAALRLSCPPPNPPPPSLFIYAMFARTQWKPPSSAQYLGGFEKARRKQGFGLMWFPSEH